MVCTTVAKTADCMANSSVVLTADSSGTALIDRGHILNVNVGILGHVDSGKTSLVKALSTHLSTAALDKNPQSQQRGITLDLGKISKLIRKLRIDFHARERIFGVYVANAGSINITCDFRI